MAANSVVAVSRVPRARRGFRLPALALACATVLAACGAIAPTAIADDPGADAGAATVHVVLRKGDRGAAVKRLQRALHISADGVFGSDTRRAVKQFQQRHHLTADGIVGPQTRRALGLRAFKSSEVRHGRHKRAAKRRANSGGEQVPRILQLIAQCESGGDPKSVSSDGQYRGKYQFLRSTWKSNGGHGQDPAKASEREQDRVALRLYRAEGITPWPVCGRKAKAQLG